MKKISHKEMNKRQQKRTEDSNQTKNELVDFLYLFYLMLL